MHPELLSATELPSLALPEATPMDLKGRYVGPASCSSEETPHQEDSMLSTFMFSDAPLPVLDPMFCVVISSNKRHGLYKRLYRYNGTQTGPL